MGRDRGSCGGTNVDSPSRELLQSYRDTFRFVYRMLGHRQEAEDVVQEAFLRLAREEDARLCGLAARRWVFVVARNLSIGRLRHRARHPEAPLPESALSPTRTPSEVGEANEIAQHIREAILSLPLDLREAVILREYERLSYEEIALLQGCAVGTVKSRLARAREALRGLLRPLVEANRCTK